MTGNQGERVIGNTRNWEAKRDKKKLHQLGGRVRPVFRGRGDSSKQQQEGGRDFENKKANKEAEAKRSVRKGSSTPKEMLTISQR